MRQDGSPPTWGNCFHAPDRCSGVPKKQKAMGETYAIAELQGRFDLLERALAPIAERAEPPATLVTLGDYVDRGPDGRKIIERLMAGLGRGGWGALRLK